MKIFTKIYDYTINFQKKRMQEGIFMGLVL